MSGRIVLFGATGYTGRLAADEMVRRGMKPVLAARSADKLERLADELGGELEVRTADVADPPSVRALVERGDVLVTTVGPFRRWGAPAVAAAVTAGAHYLDSTGEPPFIHEIFTRYAPAARKSGCGLLTAFGYDFVPGNLAGALALDRAGEAAARVDVGYFFSGESSPDSMSGGTRASLLGIVGSEQFGFRDGRVRAERAAARVRSFRVRGRERTGISIGSSEHFALPRLAPGLREVNAYLGWFGPASRPLQVVSAISSPALRLPGASRAWEALSGRLAKGSSGGPDAEARARSGSRIAAAAYDAAGRQLSEVELEGPNGYTLTGRLLAWGAEQAAAGKLKGAGALGPVDGFGLEELRAGCDELGLHETGRPAASAGRTQKAAARA